MKKPCRKLSLLLAAVLLFSTLSTSVFAASLQGTAKMSSAPVMSYATDYYGRLTDVRNSVWYKFKTKSYDAFYTVTVKNVSVPNSIHAYLTDPYQEELDRYTYFSKNYSFESNIKLKKSRWYYINVRNAGSGSGNIKLSVKVAKDAVGDTMGTAKEISLNTSYVGSMDGREDVDWIKVKTAVSGYHRFVIKNVSVDSSIHAYVTNRYGEELDYKTYFTSNYYLDTKIKLSKQRYYYIKIVTTGGTGKYKVLVKK